jgi:hypothetical protein
MDTDIITKLQGSRAATGRVLTVRGIQCNRWMAEEASAVVC